VIGRYRLIERIARGGMGTVWLASRADGQFEQDVALKLVKRGMDTDEIIARFLRERQILARLQHPHIARLLDGGVSDDGRPYFVMEHVHGVPITQYCRDRAVALTARLVLFETVCHAVQYAHRSLVVHRDLKPSNVLVTETGDVKLLDFGIAKLLDEDDPGTLTGWSRPYTPEYATPEQLTGEPITTACDVYQLGLLLHELLTGALPYRINRRNLGEARALICDTEPPPPSSIDNRTDLRGDLDTIALTALQKRPDARYRSAEALADDVHRHRQGRPISVRGNAAGYRVTKFLRRNRLRISLIATGVTLALGLFVAYAWRVGRERDRAVLAAAKAGQSDEFIRRFFQGWNPGAADRHLVSVDDQLGLATRRAEQELGATPEMQARMFSLLGSLYTDVGRYVIADSLLTRASNMQRRLGDEASADVAATRSRQGALYMPPGRLEEAETTLRTAFRLNTAVFGAGHPETLRAQYDLAVVLERLDRWAAAEAQFRGVLAAADAQSAAASLLRAEATTELGYALFQQARFAEARTILEGALDAQRRAFGDMNVLTNRTMRSLASVLRDMGDLRRAGRCGLCEIEDGDAVRTDICGVKLLLIRRDHDHVRAVLAGAHYPIDLVRHRVVTSDRTIGLRRKIQFRADDMQPVRPHQGRYIDAAKLFRRCDIDHRDRTARP
ncbi:MAG: serine/threonine-protein kinase, partial [Gemmatimonas sp.]